MIFQRYHVFSLNFTKLSFNVKKIPLKPDNLIIFSSILFDDLMNSLFLSFLNLRSLADWRIYFKLFVNIGLREFVGYVGSFGLWVV